MLAYRLLLHLYPSSFRAEYGDEMRAIFARRWQETPGALPRLALLAGGTGRGSYGAEADVSPATASADFRRLLDAGLVVQQGSGRNVEYVAAEELRDDVAAKTDAGQAP